MTENRTYSEADVTALKQVWEREQVQNALVTGVAEIRGQMAGMPAMIEATARRVFADLMLAQHAQRSERTWGRAPVLIQLGQFLITIVLAVLAYLAGQGKLP